MTSTNPRWRSSRSDYLYHPRMVAESDRLGSTPVDTQAFLDKGLD